MKHIKEALMLNPDFVPQGRTATMLKKEERGEMIAVGINIKSNQDSKNSPNSQNLNVKEKDKKEKIRIVC